jgi:hypothetical protein
VNQPLVSSFGDVLALAIVIMGLLLAFFSFSYYRASKDKWRWVKLLYIATGIWWSFLYFWILLLPGPDASWLGPVLLRPSILITLTFMTMGALARVNTK